VKKKPSPKVLSAGHALITKEMIMPNKAINTEHAKNWVIAWKRKSCTRWSLAILSACGVGAE
jgi:hypothetical protein